MVRCFRDQVGIFGILLLTSKGSAGVAGAGLVTLDATLSTFDTIPTARLALLLGVNWFMSEARAVVNLMATASPQSPSRSGRASSIWTGCAN